MTKLFTLTFLFLLLSSCANLSKNFVKKGEISFRGGTYHDEKWSDLLTFSRTGWYHDMNLYFEVMATRPVEQSPFTKWFSENERQMISDCGDFILVMTYELDSERLSYTHFREEMERHGYRTLAINNFSRHIKLHPASEDQGLRLYKVQGFCKARDIPQSTIVVRFPGFMESTIF